MVIKCRRCGSEDLRIWRSIGRYRCMNCGLIVQGGEEFSYKDVKEKEE